MKFGIYCESYEGHSLGGREFIVAVLCDVLGRMGHEVEFVHHMRSLTAEAFASHFGLSAEWVRLRFISPHPAASLRNINTRRRWKRQFSAPYDCFINIVHDRPVQCYAPVGVLMVLFPFFEPFDPQAGRKIPVYGDSWLWVLARHLRDRLGWRRTLESYSVKTAISGYAKYWTQRRWRMATEVVYPPSEPHFTEVPKRDLILSVGRFSGEQHNVVNKRQLETMQAFCELARGEQNDWRYVSAGGLGSSAQEQDYFRSVQRLASATTGRAEALGNVEREKLKSLYGAAKIFWHAVGLGNDEEKTPELSEHYGIATVDAMAAGCVPVVIRKGAQGETVEHGVSGFLCDNMDQVKQYTRELMHDRALVQQMSRNAKARAESFTRSAFVERFCSLLRQALPDLVLSSHESRNESATSLAPRTES